MKQIIGAFISVLIIISFIVSLLYSSVGNSKPISEINANSWPNVVVPQHLLFAGEKVPLEYFDVKESLDRELLAVANWHSRTFLLLKRSNRWFPVIERILKQNNIPEDFKYLAVAESGLLNDVSPAGARGVWQFMDKTAIEYGLEINEDVDERYHLEKSTLAACRYLQKAYDKLGSWALVAASYNMGRSALERRMIAQRQTSYWNLALNTETARYLYRILAIKVILENPAEYGYKLKPSELYPPIETRVLSVDSSITSFADFAISQGSNYKMLKYFNPWLRLRGLENPGGKTYLIVLPKEKVRESVYAY